MHDLPRPSASGRVAIVTGAPLCRNPRVVKEANALSSAGYEVTVLRPVLDEATHTLDSEIEVVAPWSVQTTADLTAGRLGFLTRLERRIGSVAVQYARWPAASSLGYGVGRTLQLARALRADLTIGHQEVGLVVADRLAREGRRTGADIEDWYSEDLLTLDRVGRPVALLRHAEAAVVRRGGSVTTTSSALASALATAAGGPPPTTIYNVFPFSDREQMDGERRDRPPGDHRPSLHWVSQTIGPGRGLDDLFEALHSVQTPVAVHLRGNLSPADDAWVQTACPPPHGLYTHSIVPPKQLLSRIAEHDIGLALERPTPPSRDLTVTNKLFHYLVGGLAVVATNTGGQSEIADAAPAAVLLCQNENPAHLAEALNILLETPGRLTGAKQAALDAARTRFCWERQAPVLVESVARALAEPVHW